MQGRESGGSWFETCSGVWYPRWRPCGVAINTLVDCNKLAGETPSFTKHPRQPSLKDPNDSYSVVNKYCGCAILASISEFWPKLKCWLFRGLPYRELTLDLAALSYLTISCRICQETDAVCHALMEQMHQQPVLMLVSNCFSPWIDRHMNRVID